MPLSPPTLSLLNNNDNIHSPQKNSTIDYNHHQSLSNGRSLDSPLDLPDGQNNKQPTSPNINSSGNRKLTYGGRKFNESKQQNSPGKNRHQSTTPSAAAAMTQGSSTDDSLSPTNKIRYM